jgi:hypothetical protein
MRAMANDAVPRSAAQVRHHIAGMLSLVNSDEAAESALDRAGDLLPNSAISLLGQSLLIYFDDLLG